MTARHLACCAATWPAAAERRLGPWTIRDGAGGGKRVSAATAEAPVTSDDLPMAEAAMRGLHQPPLFQIRDGDEKLDALLARQGYRVIDPVLILDAPVALLTETPPAPVTAFTIWEPLAIMEEIWAEDGIGPARIAVMHRAGGPKTAVLGRARDRAAGAAFVAIQDRMAMLHALVVSKSQRRQRTAVNMMRAAALWAQDEGADTVSVLVTEANGPARALYASMGFKVVGHYFYRMKEAE